jgi:hypothetical protein
MNSNKYGDVLKTLEEKKRDLLIKFHFGFSNVGPPDRKSDGSLVYSINDTRGFGVYPQIIQFTNKVLTVPDVDEFKKFIEQEHFSVGTLITTKRAFKTARKRASSGNQVKILDDNQLKKEFNLTKGYGLDKAAEAWDKSRNWEKFN